MQYKLLKSIKKHCIIKKEVIMFKFSIMVVLLASSLSAQQIPPRISIDKLPENVDELLRLRGELARNPSGAAALFAVALQVYARNK